MVHPYMDLKKSTDINMDIHDFCMSAVFNYPHKCGYPQYDIHAGTSMQGHSAMDIRKQ